MKFEIDIDEDYYKIICKRVEENKPYHSPYEYEVIADGKPLEQESINDTISKLLDETFDDFCECPGGEGWFYIDGEEHRTDAGYALEGMEIFIYVLKKRLAIAYQQGEAEKGERNGINK